VIIPPRHWAIIDNPVVKEIVEGLDGNNVEIVKVDDHGQHVLRYGDQEVRFEQDPFPLYPGEKLNGNVRKLQIIGDQSAYHLKAKRDFIDRFSRKDMDGKFIHVHRNAGDEWLVRGPCTYYPQIEVEVINSINAILLNSNQAVRVRARETCYDHNQFERKAGEEWIVKKIGSYLPDVYEEVVNIMDAIILTQQTALHVRALKTFNDRNDILRKAGSQWLITRDDCEVFIPDIGEEVITTVYLNVLTSSQYCVILDPVNKDGIAQLGEREVRPGPCTFFLKPGETFATYISDKYILSADADLWLTSKQEFFDENNVKRRPGDKWIIYGPREYCPPTEVQVTNQQYAILKIESLNIYIFSLTKLIVCLILLFSILFYYYDKIKM